MHNLSKSMQILAGCGRGCWDLLTEGYLTSQPQGSPPLGLLTLGPWGSSLLLLTLSNPIIPQSLRKVLRLSELVIAAGLLCRAGGKMEQKAASDRAVHVEV